MGSFTLGDDGTVYIGSHSQRVFALTPGGKLVWKSPRLAGYIISAPAVGDDGRVYIGVVDPATPTYFVSNAGGKTAYALDGKTGEVVWSVVTGDDVFASPSLVDDVVIFANEVGRVMALRQVWGAGAGVTWGHGCVTVHVLLLCTCCCCCCCCAWM